MKRLPALICAALGVSLLGAGFGSFQIETRPDRTAFFVGEPLRYQVKIRHEPGVQFVVDKLNEGSLRMDPFQVTRLSYIDADRLLTLDLQLVTFDTSEKRRWEIPAFNLYYTRGEQAGAGGAAVETIVVPATPVVLRSALPDGALLIRDGVNVGEAARPFWIALLIGLLGVIAAGVPAARSLYHWIKRDRTERILDRAERRREMARIIRELSRHSQDGPASSMKFYEGLAGELRKYSGELAGKAGAALTAGQVQEFLLAAGESDSTARELSELVAFADEVRYSAGGAEAGLARLEEVRGRASRLFGS